MQKSLKKKIGNRFFSFILIFPFCCQLIAQPSIEMYVDDTEMFIGDRTRLVIQIWGNFSKVNEPNFPKTINGMQVLNTNPSVSISTSSINGVISRRYNYIYTLRAIKEGVYTVPSISLRVGGKSYQTKPINIKVYKRSKKASLSTGGRKPSIYAEMKLSNTTPVAGEQIEAKVFLYIKKGLEVLQYTSDMTWKAEGFWKENVKNRNKSLQVSSIIIDGISYLKSHIHSIILFPTRSGKLTLSPYTFTVSIRQNSQNRDPFSSFFSPFGGSLKDVSLSTNKMMVEVSEIIYPWPSDVYFNGVVGEFTVSRIINKTEIEVGETIEVTTTFKGQGNLPFLPKPLYNFPSSFEIYDPIENLNTNSSSFPLRGTKAFHDILVPRKKGTFYLPVTKLAVFNPKISSPQIFILPALRINVKENPFLANKNQNNQVSNLYSTQGGLKTGLIQWKKINKPFLDSSQTLIWILFTLPLGLYIVGLCTHRYYTKVIKDEKYIRSKNAYHIASALLDEAKECVKTENFQEGYHCILKALTGFISDKLDLPRAGLSITDYIDNLHDHNIEKKSIDTIKSLLNMCDSISYAPSVSLKSLSDDIELSYHLLNTLKKKSMKL